MKQDKRLGLFSISMIVVSLVIGMGIFRAASVTAGVALNPTIFFCAWFFGGLVALCGAMTYAEIGSRFPVTGGYYRVFSEAYHPSIAFAINGVILVSNAASLGGVALIGSEYFCAYFLPGSEIFWKPLIAVIMIAVFYGLNLFGLRMSSNTLNILMLVKIAMILFVIAALFFPESHAQSSFANTVGSAPGLKDWITSFGAALVTVSFTYGGYQQTINFGEDVKEPGSTVPKGILIGMTLVLILYMLINYSYYKVLGFNELKQANGIAAVVVDRWLGPGAATIFSIFLVLAVLSFVNVNLMSNPRVMYAMSRDGVLPKSFAARWERREVYFVGLSVFALTSIVVVFFAETFERILGFVMILDSLGMMFSAASIFYFRKRMKDQKEGTYFSMRFYPFLPLVFIAAYFFVCVSSILMNPYFGLTTVAVLISLLVIYKWIMKPGLKMPET